MPADLQYQSKPTKFVEREHCYGSNVHLVDDPYLLALVAKLSTKACKEPLLNSVIEQIYTSLFQKVAAVYLERGKIAVPTRMSKFHPQEGVFSGDIIEPDQRVVFVDLARAGMLPSSVGFQLYCGLLNPDCVRVDHIFISRQIDDLQQVVGADVAGNKIGGSVDGVTLIVPDPMLATASSLLSVLSLYEKLGLGQPKRIISLHMIAAPEGVQRVVKERPDVELVTLRLDRGLSSAEVLNSIPGQFPDQEKGLNEKQYIVPGAGGLGELMNHSFV
jgi:uracil phosphoribosyltransferase